MKKVLLLLLTSFTISAQTLDTLYHATFESGTNSFTNAGLALFERNTTTPIQGTGDLHISASSPAGCGIITPFTLVAGSEYTISFKARQVGGIPIKFRMATSVAYTTAISGWADTTITATSNQTYSFKRTPSVTTGYLTLQFADWYGEGWIDEILITWIPPYLEILTPANADTINNTRDLLVTWTKSTADPINLYLNDSLLVRTTETSYTISQSIIRSLLTGNVGQQIKLAVKWATEDTTTTYNPYNDHPTANTGPMSGSGTISNPYIINSAQQYVDLVKATPSRMIGAYYIVMGNDWDFDGIDIKMSDGFWKMNVNIDGQNFTIKNLTINRPQGTQLADYDLGQIGKSDISWKTRNFLDSLYIYNLQYGLCAIGGFKDLRLDSISITIDRPATFIGKKIVYHDGSIINYYIGGDPGGQEAMPYYSFGSFEVAPLAFELTQATNVHATNITIYIDLTSWTGGVRAPVTISGLTNDIWTGYDSTYPEWITNSNANISVKLPSWSLATADGDSYIKVGGITSRTAKVYNYSVGVSHFGFEGQMSIFSEASNIIRIGAICGGDNYSGSMFGGTGISDSYARGTITTDLVATTDTNKSQGGYITILSNTTGTNISNFSQSSIGMSAYERAGTYKPGIKNCYIDMSIVDSVGYQYIYALPAGLNFSPENYYEPDANSKPQHWVISSLDSMWSAPENSFYNGAALDTTITYSRYDRYYYPSPNDSYYRQIISHNVYNAARTAGQMKLKSTYENSGWDFRTDNAWRINASLNDGFPNLWRDSVFTFTSSIVLGDSITLNVPNQNFNGYIVINNIFTTDTTKGRNCIEFTDDITSIPMSITFTTCGIDSVNLYYSTSPDSSQWVFITNYHIIRSGNLTDVSTVTFNLPNNRQHGEMFFKVEEDVVIAVYNLRTKVLAELSLIKGTLPCYHWSRLGSWQSGSNWIWSRDVTCGWVASYRDRQHGFTSVNVNTRTDEVTTTYTINNVSYGESDDVVAGDLAYMSNSSNIISNYPITANGRRYWYEASEDSVGRVEGQLWMLDLRNNISYPVYIVDNSTGLYTPESMTLAFTSDRNGLVLYNKNLQLGGTFGAITEWSDYNYITVNVAEPNALVFNLLPPPTPLEKAFDIWKIEDRDCDDDNNPDPNQRVKYFSNMFRGIYPKAKITRPF